MTADRARSLPSRGVGCPGRRSGGSGCRPLPSTDPNRDAGLSIGPKGRTCYTANSGTADGDLRDVHKRPPAAPGASRLLCGQSRVPTQERTASTARGATARRAAPTTVVKVSTTVTATIAA